MDEASADKLSRGALCEADLVFSAKKDDVRKCCFDSVADAADDLI